MFFPRSHESAKRADLSREDLYEGTRLRQEEEYSVQVVVGKNQEVLGTFCSCNSLWHGIPFSIELLDDPVLTDLVLKMTGRLTEIGLIGPCNFQARRTSDGRYKFFEVNARFTGITPVRAEMGFNECDACYRHFVEGVDKPPLTAAIDSCAFRYIAHDIFKKADLNALERSGRWAPSFGASLD